MLGRHVTFVWGERELIAKIGRPVSSVAYKTMDPSGNPSYFCSKSGMIPIVIDSEETHVGLVYMWMHGLKLQYQFRYQTTYSTSIKIVVQVNIDSWWVSSQDERISVYPSNYLGQAPS